MKVVLVKVIFSYNHLVAMAALAILEVHSGRGSLALGNDVFLNKNKTKHLGGSGRARGGLANSGG